MFGSTTVRWLGAVWLLLMGAGLVAATGLIPWADWLPDAGSSAGEQLVKRYNLISHIIFLIGLTVASTGLIWAAHHSDQSNSESTSQRGLAIRLIHGIKQHPIVTGLFAFYAALMMKQASWFYKEIISWYKGILGHHLLDNFSLRWEFVQETMFRNDFRFFPLSHQDLHILSWFTPYVSIWMLVNAAELFLIVVLGSKIIATLSEQDNRRETLLMFSILFLFDAATGFTFFQFIYSERIVVLFFSLFAFHYSQYFKLSRTKDAYLSILYALLGLFFKDTAFILFTVPAFTVILVGSLGLLANKPKFSVQALQDWSKAYALELSLSSLVLVLGMSFLYLSYLPSLYVGVKAYDSYLRFSRFEPDFRFLVLLGVSCIRAVMIVLKKLSFSLLDAINAAALAYALGLFAMVGFRSSNYMALPVQFVASLDLVMLWIWGTSRCPSQRMTVGVLGMTSVLTASSLIGIEHLERRNFWSRTSKMQSNQDSWVKTLDEMKKISRQARENGDEINIIYSKSWFRNCDHLKQLTYQRLIYFDLDKNEYLIMDGAGKGSNYTPKKGDFLLNIDTGKRLREFGYDMTPYQKIWDYDPDESNGKIYRRIE
jgi:hypothetical protein